MKLNVEDKDEIHIGTTHNCGNRTEGYAAIEGSFDRPGLSLLKCENCGEAVPVAVYETKAKEEMAEILTGHSLNR